MQRFRFRLQRVLEFRRTQQRLEEQKLEEIHGRRKRLEAERAALGSERDREAAAAQHSGSLEAGVLGSLDRYGDWVRRESARLGRQAADCARQAAEQRTAVAEARRRVRLMENLQQRQFEEWSAAFERELEALAAESHLARHAREMRRASGGPESGQPPGI